MWRVSFPDLLPRKSTWPLLRPVTSEAQPLLATAVTQQPHGDWAAVLGHILRMPHPKHQRLWGLPLETSAKKPAWASRSISGCGSKVLHPGPRSRDQLCSLMPRHQNLHTVLAPLPLPAQISQKGQALGKAEGRPSGVLGRGGMGHLQECFPWAAALAVCWGLRRSREFMGLLRQR